MERIRNGPEAVSLEKSLLHVRNWPFTSTPPHPTPVCLNELYFRQPLPVTSMKMEVMWLRQWMLECGSGVWFFFCCPRATCLSDFKLVVCEQVPEAQSLGACGGVSPACLLTRLSCPPVVAAPHPRIISRECSGVEYFPALEWVSHG